MLSILLVTVISRVFSERIQLKDSEVYKPTYSTAFEFYYELESLKPDHRLIITVRQGHGSSSNMIFVSKGRIPDRFQFDWSSSTNLTVNYIVLSHEELVAPSMYGIVLEDNYIEFITVQYLEPFDLVDSRLYSHRLENSHTVLYRITPDSADHFHVTIFDDAWNQDVLAIADFPTGPVEFQYEENEQIFDSSTLSDRVDTFQFIVTPIFTPVNYTIFWTPTESGGKQLSTGKQYTGYLFGSSKTSVYLIEVTRHLDLVIELSPQKTQIELHVAGGRLPTDADYDFVETFWGDQSMVLTKSMRQALNLVTGTYYLLLSSYGSTTFFLSVYYKDDALPLRTGVPYHVDSTREFAQYSLALHENQDYNVTARLKAPSSDGYLYMKQCETHDTCLLTPEERNNPSRYGISYIHSIAGMTELQHSINSDHCKDTPCEVFVGFEPESATEYTLTVGSPIVMRMSSWLDGLVSRQVAAGKTMYFQYTLKNEVYSMLTFRLYVTEGSVNLYASRNLVPTPFYYEKAAGSTTEVTIQFVNGVDVPGLDGVYNLLVYGVQASTFSIRVVGQRRESADFQLIEGIFQSHRMTYEEWVQSFDFTLNNLYDERDTLTVLQTQEIGLTQFSVSSPRDVRRNDHFLQKTRSIVFRGNETDYGLSGQYSVSIQSWKPSLDGYLKFALMYKTSKTIFNLTVDEPWQDEVSEGSYKFYAVELETATQNVSIELTSDSGNARLFLSFNERYPMQDYCDKQAESVLSVTSEEIDAVCLDHKTNLHWYKCSVYISVYGETSSEYTLQVQLSEVTPLKLELNEEFSVKASDRRNLTFYAVFEDTTPSSLEIQTNQGTLGIFGEVLSGTLPPQGTPNTHADQHLFIQHDLVWPVPHTYSQTLLHFMVACTLGDCKYTLKPRQDVIRPLALNESVQRQISAGQMEYFRFNCSTQRDLNVTLQSAKPVSVYASKMWSDSVTLPTAEVYDWSMRNGVIILSQFDPTFASHSSTLVGGYFLGLTAGTFAEYSLAVRYVDSPVIPLTNAAIITLSPGQYQYYLHMHQDTLDLALHWSKATGSARVYITTLADSSQVYSHLPSQQNWFWTFAFSSESFRFAIKEADKNACVDCAYVMGIVAEDSEFSATLQAQSGAFTQILSENQELRGEGSQGEVYYYHYTVSTDTDIQLSVISDGPPVTVEVMNAENECAPATWKMTKDETLFEITSADPKFKIGTYSVRVTLTAACSYRIKAAQVQPVHSLENGVQKTFTLSAGVLIFQSVAQTDVHTYCNLLSCTEGFKPRVYISYTASATDPPSPQNAEKTYLPGNYAGEVLSFAVKAENMFFIGVYQDSPESSPTGKFSLDCSLGVPTFNHPLGEFQVYETASAIEKVKVKVTVPRAGDLVVHLNACSAFYRAEVSRTWSFQSSDTETAQTESEGSLRAVYSVQSAGTYYIQAILTRSLGKSKNAFSLYAGLADAGRASAFEIVSGNHGKLVLRQGSPMAISWTGAQYSNGTSVKQSVVYDVYLTKTLQAFYSTPCSIEMTRNSHKLAVGSEHSASLNVEESGEYLVNVLGRTHTINIAYTPITVLLEHTVSNSHWQVWLLVSVLTVLLLFVVAYLVYRWRKSTRNELGHIELPSLARPKQFVPLEDSSL